MIVSPCIYCLSIIHSSKSPLYSWHFKLNTFTVTTTCYFVLLVFNIVFATLPTPIVNKVNQENMQQQQKTKKKSFAMLVRHLSR